MTEKDEVIIPLSKLKLALNLIGVMLFVGIGIWFAVHPYQTDNSTALSIMGVVIVLLFGAVAVFLVKKLGDNKPGLVIGREGVLDNSSGVAAGLIKWADLEEIRVIKFKGQRFIMLFVKDPQAYIDRETSRLKRMTMQTNYNMYGTPLSISTNALKCRHNELVGLLKSKWEQEKASNA